MRRERERERDGRLFADGVDDAGCKRFQTAFLKGWQAGLNINNVCPYANKGGGIAYRNKWFDGYQVGINEG